MAADEDYAYQALPLGSIRIVNLYPGKGDEILRCSIQVVYLDDRPSYEALSYVWGSTTPKRRLQLDNKWLSITTNLSAALHQLRLPDQTRSLWIDQVCINQMDLDERSSQVNMMGSIYSYAKHVVAWLGEDHLGEAVIARNFIFELLFLKKKKFFAGLHVMNDEFLAEQGLPPRSSQKWTALNHLVQLRYFRRVWIIQEARLATTCALLWGACGITLRDLISLIPWLLSLCLAEYSESPLDEDAIVRVLNLKAQREDSMRNLLKIASSRDATDERDKVFAILGLVEGGPPFQADYRKTLAEIHYEALIALFSGRSDFDFLTWPQADGNACKGTATWPSWLPKSWDGDLLLSDPLHGFNVGGRYPLNPPTVRMNRTEVKIPGFRVFKVRDVGLPVKDNHEITHVVNQISIAWNLVRQNAHARRIDYLFQNFLWTLLCGSMDAIADPLSAKSDLHLWDDQLLVDFAGFWHKMLLHSFDNQSVNLVSFVEHQLPVVQSILIAMHCVVMGTPFPDPGDFIAFSDFYNNKVVCFLKQRYPEIWTVVAEHLRKDISDRRLTNEGVDTATEMLIPLWFLDPKGDDTKFLKRWRESREEHCFFITETGHMGMGPDKIREGDFVAVLAKIPVPLILRRVKSTVLRFQVIGPCYTNAIMHGEVIDALQSCGELVDFEETLVLV